MKPRLGFLRSREFIMKDLYTFDATLDNAQHTYDLVCESYDNIFKQIGIKYTKGIYYFYNYIYHIYRYIIIKLKGLYLTNFIIIL